ncbi:N-acetyltransferase 8B-like [Pogona vitticeps]
MTEYHIRTYEDRDYEAARAIFASGLMEHNPAVFRYILSRPQAHLLLLGAFLLAYVASVSVLFSLGVVSALLVLGWIQTKASSNDYIQGALDGDMRDIRGTYLERKDCCFWVVDDGEEVVGTVAVTHPEEPSWRGRALELKRMSVKEEHRGRGISKALTRTVIRFAQERGYKEVVLGTSIVQTAAQRVYESMGFRRVRIIHPFLLLKLLNFHIYIYRYEILETY